MAYDRDHLRNEISGNPDESIFIRPAGPGDLAGNEYRHRPPRPPAGTFWITSCVYWRSRSSMELEGGEEVSRLLGDLGGSLPVADFEIRSSDEVSSSLGSKSLSSRSLSVWRGLGTRLVLARLSPVRVWLRETKSNAK